MKRTEERGCKSVWGVGKRFTKKAVFQLELNYKEWWERDRILKKGGKDGPKQCIKNRVNMGSSKEIQELVVVFSKRQVISNLSVHHFLNHSSFPIPSYHPLGLLQAQQPNLSSSASVQSGSWHLAKGGKKREGN